MSKVFDFFKSNFTIFSFVIYIINIALIIYFNPMNVMSEFTRITTFFIVFAGFFNILLLYYFNKNSDQKSDQVTNYLYVVGKAISVLFIFYGIIYATFYFIVFAPWPLTILVTILNILMSIGMLALIYKYFENKAVDAMPDKSSTSGKVLQLIKHLILYFPCLLIDLVNYIKHQYKITTKTVWLILLIEIVIIALRFGLPHLYGLFHYTGGNLVAKGPVYLNNEKDLGVFQNKKPLPESTKKHSFNYNYAVSTWIWINPQPSSTSPAYNESTTLLNYGNVLKINYNKNNLEILASSTENNNETEFGKNEVIKVYELKDIPYQRWNNIILNYSGGTLDIFINNSLVSSTINITPVMYYDKVISGSKNGIHGGIRDLIYYDKVLTKNDIYSIYTIG